MHFQLQAARVFTTCIQATPQTLQSALAVQPRDNCIRQKKHMPLHGSANQQPCRQRVPAHETGSI